MSIFTISPIWPSWQMVSHIPYPPPILTKHHTWYLVNADLFISICGILFGLLSISLFSDHYGRSRTQMTRAQGFSSSLPLALWWSQPTFLYTVPLIFLSTSQFCWHKTGLEEYTWLLHRLVPTRTHGNSNMQINWNTVQFFHLYQKTSIAGRQFILWDGSTATTSLASTT